MSEAFISGGWRGHDRAEVYAGGAWRRIVRAEAYISGAWRLIARYLDPVSVAVPSAASAGISNHLTRPVTLSIAAVPSGGLPPYTYLWTVTGDVGGAATIVGSNAMATVTATMNVPPEQDYSSTLNLTVTDSLGGPASGSCFCTFSNFGG